MKILLCDDDLLFMHKLQGYIVEYFQKNDLPVPNIYLYTSGEDLLNMLTQDDVGEIAFLDVEMSGQSGIYVGAKLAALNPRMKIIIVTSYTDYLDEAMRFHVFRYLSKPVDKNRLFRNLKDALYQYSIQSRPFPIETENGVEVFDAEDIVCIESERRSSVIYTVKKTLKSYRGIDFWHQKTDLPCFYVPHRSFIINFRYVSSFGKDQICLQYAGHSITAYLSKRKYRDFKDTYLLYMESVK